MDTSFDRVDILPLAIDPCVATVNPGDDDEDDEDDDDDGKSGGNIEPDDDEGAADDDDEDDDDDDDDEEPLQVSPGGRSDGRRSGRDLAGMLHCNNADRVRILSRRRHTARS